MSTTEQEISFTVYGEPASKANSRRKVNHPRTGKPMFIKSDKARQYEIDFNLQCPQLGEKMFKCDVEVTIRIYYASRKPDLDESVILDCMQGKIYKNDRQVKRKLIEWGLDRKNPRALIHVKPF